MQEVSKTYLEIVEDVIPNLTHVGLTDKNEDKVDYAVKRISKNLTKSLKPLETEMKEKEEIITEEIELKYVLTEKVGDKQKIVYDEIKLADGSVKRVFAYTPEDLVKKNNELRKAYKELREEYNKREVVFDSYFCDENEERLKNIDEDVKEKLKGILFE